jgi:hypothetical protein
VECLQEPSQDEGTAFSEVAEVPFWGVAEARAARAREREAVVKRMFLLFAWGEVKRVWDRLNGV